MKRYGPSIAGFSGGHRARPMKSSAAAKRENLPSVEHRQPRYLNNRAENSHQPTRQRERRMQGFTSESIKLAPPAGCLPRTVGAIGIVQGLHVWSGNQGQHLGQDSVTMGPGSNPTDSPNSTLAI